MTHIPLTSEQSKQAQNGRIRERAASSPTSKEELYDASEEDVAAIHIQRCYRRIIHHRRISYECFVRAIICVRAAAAEEVQRTYRGYLARRVFDEERGSIVFRWNGHKSAKHNVMLVGDFTAEPWLDQLKMTYCPVRRCYTRAWPFHPSTYLYKFVVDGIWLIDPSQPHQEDSTGHVNNILRVKDRPVSARFPRRAPSHNLQSKYDPSLVSATKAGRVLSPSHVPDKASSPSLRTQDALMIADESSTASPSPAPSRTGWSAPRMTLSSPTDCNRKRLSPPKLTAMRATKGQLSQSLWDDQQHVSLRRCTTDSGPVFSISDVTGSRRPPTSRLLVALSSQNNTRLANPRQTSIVDRPSVWSRTSTSSFDRRAYARGLSCGALEICSAAGTVV